MPAALSTASSIVLTARLSISRSLTCATLVAARSPNLGTLVLTTSSGVSSSGEGTSAKSATVESPAVIVTAFAVGWNPIAATRTVRSPAGSGANR